MTRREQHGTPRNDKSHVNDFDEVTTTVRRVVEYVEKHGALCMFRASDITTASAACTTVGRILRARGIAERFAKYGLQVVPGSRGRYHVRRLPVQAPPEGKK